MESLRYIAIVLTIISPWFQAACGAIKMDEPTTKINLEEGKSTSIHCTLKIPVDRICNKRIFSWVFVNETGKESYIANATSVKKRQYDGQYSASYYEKATFASDLMECVFILELLNGNSRLEGRYSCRWGNQMSTEVTVNLIPSQESVQPQCSIQVMNPNQTVQEVELVCFASPINPSVKLLWLEEGQLMTLLEREARPGSSNSKAVLLPRNDSQTDITYVCQAFNETDHELPGRCSITCHIDISILATMEDDSGQPKGTFKCPFNMSLEGIRYERQWLLDGEPIDSHDQTDRFIIEGHTGLLHMTDILPGDNGRLLSCTVNTMFGSYSAETLIAWDMSEPTKEPQAAGPQSRPFSSLLLVVLVVGILFVVAINVFVCAVVMKSRKSRGQKHRTVDQDAAAAVAPHMYHQQEAMYASGIVVVTTDTNVTTVVNEGYTHMTDIVCQGHYDPEEPYQAMNNSEGKRDSEYQVPKVDRDGAPIKRQQSAKYMNTCGGGGKSKGFNVFRFSKRKEPKCGKSANLKVGEEGENVSPISPNCYATPQYTPDSKLSAPRPSNVNENDYDELNLKEP